MMTIGISQSGLKPVPTPSSVTSGVAVLVRLGSRVGVGMLDKVGLGVGVGVTGVGVGVMVATPISLVWCQAERRWGISYRKREHEQ